MNLSLGFLYLSCTTHAQLSKATNRIECEIGCVGVEGFVDVRSISRFCECDLL